MRKVSLFCAAVATLVAVTAAAGGASAGGSPSTTALASSINPSTVGQTTTLTATVTSAGTCSGTVQFLNGATPLTCTGGNQTLVAAGGNNYTATCQVAFQSAGPQTLTAAYSQSNINCNNSTSNAFTQTVNAAAATVPTLGGWAAFLFTGLLLGGGLWVMTRRNNRPPISFA